MKINWILEKENLTIMIGKLSYEEIGRYYGVTGAAVKKAAKKLGISLPLKRTKNPNEHFNKGKKQNFKKCKNCGQVIVEKNEKYCSNKCQKDFEFKTYIEKWKKGEVNGLRGQYSISNHIRKYMFEKHNYSCEKCGWNEVNKYSCLIPLEIHHIDGDYTNNREENLQVLCPNCHSLTETYKSQNKNGRKQRKNNK